MRSGTEGATAVMTARKPSLVTEALLRNFTVIFRNLLVWVKKLLGRKGPQSHIRP